MRKLSAFAAATVIAAGLVTTGATLASADPRHPCTGVSNGVAGVWVKDERGTYPICLGAGGQRGKSGSGAIIGCWAKSGHRLAIYNGSTRVACPRTGQEVRNWTKAKAA
ncbi:hypothetical protein NLX83_27345 [Allokutzneria sp. A3M-2-11 16]|uniref:hypothetical protein n=1 Tax=Allokutzneria sp. A3M-2-11 16 TaxID=2962043 RepID=UPI0020B7A33A|nr:hypothetical protein [Allokutzneria sp. A3M-2-11 16]MCP3802995.1 hypothetical protein [Allokutzneria sp. A3M-2-11 16]